jgi:hypothetical protein
LVRAGAPALQPTLTQRKNIKKSGDDD